MQETGEGTMDGGMQIGGAGRHTGPLAAGVKAVPTAGDPRLVRGFTGVHRAGAVVGPLAAGVKAAPTAGDPRPVRGFTGVHRAGGRCRAAGARWPDRRVSRRELLSGCRGAVASQACVVPGAVGARRGGGRAPVRALPAWGRAVAM